MSAFPGVYALCHPICPRCPALMPAPCMPLLAQMMRLKRELDRVTEERDRARDDSKKAEQARQQLEMELKVSQADQALDGQVLSWRMAMELKELRSRTRGTRLGYGGGKVPPWHESMSVCILCGWMCT